MNVTPKEWEHTITAIATDERYPVEVVAVTILTCGQSWFAGMSQDLDDLYHNITHYLEKHLVGIYDGSTEELYNLITGESMPHYFDADQWQFDLECDGWNFETISLSHSAAFRP